jgi:hypothetical protein
MEGGGWGSVIFAGIAVGMLIAWYLIGERWAAGLAALLALIAALFPLSYIVDPVPDGFTFPGGGMDWSADWGAWVTLVACLAVAGLSVALALLDRRSG